MLEVRLLGKFTVQVSGRPVELPLRAAQSLLAYLLLTTGAAHRREQLAGLLWPDMTEQNAKANLRHTLWRLRKALGERDYIVADDITVTFEATAEYWLDTQVIGQKADASASADDLIRVVSVYGGELLPGFYDEWVMLERERLQAAFEARTALLMERLVETQRWEEVLEWGERWIALGHTPEAAYRALIVAHSHRGDLSSAAAVYKRCVEALHTELGVEPSAQTRAVYKQLVTGETPAGAPTRPAPSPKAGDLLHQTLRGYELRERVGAGGFGAVFRAYQPTIGREVAIKVILPQHANHPDFIRRFEAEAQLVARLEHPHIVPLFDYWRDPDGAYLVMRWLPHSLRAALEKGPFTLPDALQVVEQVASALAVAHRHGIVHLDIKPDNILLDDDGNAYLADFGIARAIGEGRDGEDAGISGSLDYVSPEQIRGEAVSARTDLYGLGLVVYEMVTGRHPFLGLTPNDLIFKHLQEPLPDVSLLRHDLPDGINRVVQRATAKDPAERYPDVLALVVDLRRAVLGEAAGTALPEVELPALMNPYKGLRAFEEADAADFFGREALVNRLVAQLSEAEPLARFLAVIGPSGSGKSSVVEAGLIPALRRGAISGSAQWFVTRMTPGAQALKNLETALLSVAAKPPAFLLEQLQTNERGLLWAAESVLAGVDGDLLLVIDQFEELFTLVADDAERAQCLDLLRAAVADPRSRVRVVVTLRADFTDRPLQYVEFGELMRQRTEFVLPLAANELGRAVTGPAGRVGVRVDDDLLAAILADVREEPGALPLLQYALTETFERLPDGGRTLTLAAYHASGGVLGALARRAEEVFTGLDAAGQAAARQLFLRLVTLGEGTEDTRRRVMRAELMAISGAPLTLASPSGRWVAGEGGMSSVIAAFGKHRLLTFDHDPATRGPTVEVAHEALLREWARLREWLNASRADVRLQRQLANAAAEWVNAKREPSFLLQGARLSQFEGWAASTELALTQDEWEYLDASLTEGERQRTAEAERQRRELEAAQKLAEAERRRAEEQARAAAQLRQRALYLIGALALAIIAALAAGVFANRNGLLAADNAAIANTAQAANTQEVAQRSTAQAANGVAEQQRDAAVNAQATSQAEAVIRAEAQAEAEQAAAVSFSRELAAAAIANLDVDPERSILLALQAVAKADTWQAQDALHRAVQNSRLLNRVSGPPSGYTIAYSPDATRLVRGSFSPDGSTTYVLDATTLEVLFTVPGYFANDRWIDADRLATLDSGDDPNSTTATIWDGAGRKVSTVAFPIPFENALPFSADASPDLTQNALPTWDGLVTISDMKTGQTIQTLGEVGGPPVFTTLFSPDGKRLLTSGFNERVTLWDIASGRELRTWQTETSEMIAFSLDGKQLAFADGNFVTIVDTASGQAVLKLSGHTGFVEVGMQFNADGTRLATAALDGTARIWDTTTGRSLLKLGLESEGPPALAFSPDGTRLATTSNSGTIQIWGLTPADSREWLTVPDGGSGGVAFNPADNGAHLAIADKDRNVRILDAFSGQTVIRINNPARPTIAPAFSPDGTRLATTSEDTTVRVWDAATSQELLALLGHTIWPDRAIFSPDGTRLATISHDQTARLWDAASGQLLFTLEAFTPTISPGQAADISFHPDGTRLATAGGAFVKVWDTATGQEVLTLPIEEGQLAYSVAFSPDGTRLAVGFRGGRASVWDAATGQRLFDLVGHTGSVGRIAYSPDGTRIATGSVDGTTRLWDAATGAAQLTLTGHTDQVYNLAFSPDGARLATDSVDETARVYALRLEDLVQIARSRLTRDMTTQECRQYLHVEKCP